jgi:hypothetical protein
LPEDKARQLADRVAAEPRKFTADALAWRLRLSMAERTALKITTVGAFDLSKAERAEERKRKDREAKRARRAAARTGRPRGRPKKNASTAVRDSIAADAFSDHSPAACEGRGAPALRPRRPSVALLVRNKVKIPEDSGEGNKGSEDKTARPGIRAPARIGNQTEDSLGSVSDIPPDDESLVGLPIKPGLIRHANFSDRKRIENPSRTRIRSTFRPTRRQREIAAGLGISPDRVGDMLISFTHFHLSKGSYASDWDAVWGKWVADQIEIDLAAHRRERARAYAMRRR